MNGRDDDDRDLTLPPHSDQAELAVIGSVFKAPERLVDIGWLRPNDLYQPRHRHVFQAMVDVASAGQPPDYHLVADQLRRAGTYDSVGGMVFLSSVGLDMPTASHIEHYARIVQRTALMRQLIARAQTIAEIAYRDNLDPAVAIEKAEQLLAGLRRDGLGDQDLPVETAVELAAASAETPELIGGMAIVGGISELVGKIKGGKTTLHLEMVRAEVRGQAVLGSPARPPRPVVLLSEQPRASLRASLERAGLLDCPNLHIVRWAAVHDRPWPEVAAAASRLADRLGARLLVIDTLFAFAGISSEGGENDSSLAQQALAPVQIAVETYPLAAVVVRHEGKARGLDISDAGRGSSAFGGGVDILLRLKRPDGKAPTNQRVLEYVGRFDGIPEQRLLEWTRAQGYVDLGNPEDAGKRRAAALAVAVLPSREDGALTASEVQEQCADVGRTYLYQALAGLVAAGDICCRGKGGRGDPKRYWRPEPKDSSTSTRGCGRIMDPDSSTTSFLKVVDESVNGWMATAAVDESGGPP